MGDEGKEEGRNKENDFVRGYLSNAFRQPSHSAMRASHFHQTTAPSGWKKRHVV